MARPMLRKERPLSGLQGWSHRASGLVEPTPLCLGSRTDARVQSPWNRNANGQFHACMRCASSPAQGSHLHIEDETCVGPR